MGIIDIVCIIFLVIWFLLGLKRGFVFEILTLLLVLASFAAAYIIHPMLSDMARRFLNYDLNMDRAIFLLSFVIILAVAQIFLSRIISTLGKFDKLNPLARIMGAIVATARGILYLSAVLWLIVAFAPESGMANMIRTGLVTTKAKKVLEVTYNGIDNIVRKGNISSFRTID